MMGPLSKSPIATCAMARRSWRGDAPADGTRYY